MKKKKTRIEEKKAISERQQKFKNKRDEEETEEQRVERQGANAEYMNNRRAEIRKNESNQEKANRLKLQSEATARWDAKRNHDGRLNFKDMAAAMLGIQKK